MNKFRTILLICILLLSNFVVPAQSLSVSIDRKDILIGEPIQYNIRITVPGPGFKVQYVSPDSIPHFEILEKRGFDSVDKKGSYVQLNLKLTSWDSGKWYIPPVPIQIVRPGTVNPATIHTDPIEVNVGYAPDDGTGKLRDIKSVIPVQYVDNKWWYIIAGLLLSLILAYFIIRRLKRKAKPVQNVQRVGAYEEAIQQLQQLKSLDLHNPDDVKKYHVELADIFRQYYSRSSGKNIQSSTTTEILQQFTDKVSEPTLKDLAAALWQADFVKFARYFPQVSESQKAGSYIHNVLEYFEKRFKNTTDITQQHSTK